FGVAAFLVVITVLNSFQSEIKNIISSVNPNLMIYSSSGINNPNEFQKELKKLINVPLNSMSNFIYQESIMGLGRQTSAVYIKAIEGTKSSSASNLNPYMHPKNALQTLDVSSKLIEKEINQKTCLMLF
ncbi:MAG: hypothetical protein K2X69_06095, partial [Silvanigrellaceae bacterium]|nr:hypothetical protein [Silvanigrellaceae bacterium]